MLEVVQRKFSDRHPTDVLLGAPLVRNVMENEAIGIEATRGNLGYNSDLSYIGAGVDGAFLQVRRVVGPQTKETAKLEEFMDSIAPVQLMQSAEVREGMGMGDGPAKSYTISPRQFQAALNTARPS